ncbi:DUF1003 domain-containing protein [Candidatus Microgenomates bacterium]|nr:DUF1003 domain-containing protein [Candidatus Microgenomates bacterium]
MEEKKVKKIINLVEKTTDLTAWFLGSWWAVVFHAVWFTVWLIFDFSVEHLTLVVSLEAIFMCIFLLMAANKAEIERDLGEAEDRQWNRKMIEQDIKLDEKGERRLREINISLKEIKEELKIIKNSLRK